MTGLLICKGNVLLLTVAIRYEAMFIEAWWEWSTYRGRQPLTTQYHRITHEMRVYDLLEGL
jgi:hypothetical protein